MIEALSKNCFGTVLLSLGLLWRAIIPISKGDPCRTPRNDRS